MAGRVPTSTMNHPRTPSHSIAAWNKNASSRIRFSDFYSSSCSGTTHSTSQTTPSFSTLEVTATYSTLPSQSRDEGVPSAHYRDDCANDDAIAAKSDEALRRLISRFVETCTDFTLAISMKKTNIICQDVNTTPIMTISDYTWKWLASSPTSAPSSLATFL